MGPTLGEAQPLAVIFHEEDPSIASGLRFGRVEVLRADHARHRRGLLPRIGAEVIARDLGVPLLFNERENPNPAWRPAPPIRSRPPCARTGFVRRHHRETTARDGCRSGNRHVKTWDAPRECGAARRRCRCGRRREVGGVADPRGPRGRSLNLGWWPATVRKVPGQDAARHTRARSAVGLPWSSRTARCTAPVSGVYVARLGRQRLSGLRGPAIHGRFSHAIRPTPRARRLRARRARLRRANCSGRCLSDDLERDEPLWRREELRALAPDGSDHAEPGSRAAPNSRRTSTRSLRPRELSSEWPPPRSSDISAT